jgi:hypothetical protein
MIAAAPEESPAMFPTHEQIRMAAYYRWQRRGGPDGHELLDWLAAEQHLLLAQNYEVVAGYRLSTIRSQSLGDKDRRVCRYCERAAPRTTFVDPVPVLPESLGPSSLVTYDECQECHALFEEALRGDFDAFLRPFRPGLVPGALPPDLPAAGLCLSIPAYKYLTKIALSIMPEGELDGFPDAIEWVSNPDHGLDRGVFGGLGCDLHVTPVPFEGPWMALARRFEEDARLPSMLFFVGSGHVAFVIAVPLGLRDEDLDDGGWVIPRVASPFEVRGFYPESTYLFLPIAPADAPSALGPPADRSPDPAPGHPSPLPKPHPSSRVPVGAPARLVDALLGGGREGDAGTADVTGE